MVDARGGIVARRLGAACNPSVVGSDQARLVVTDALCGLLADARAIVGSPVVESTLLCMAGNRAFWREFAASLQDFGEVTTTDDSVPVLELATRGLPGLVVHAGTGSFVAARAPDGTVHYAGGLGWRFDDAGSGYDIGRRTIARALLELQGWTAETRLSATVRSHTSLPADADAGAITRFFYQHAEPNRMIAGLAPAVLRLLSEGDVTAQAVVSESIAELIGLATRVAAKLFPGVALDAIPAGMSGPILTHPSVVGLIGSSSPLALAPVDDTPIEGVRRLLARR